MTLLPINMQSGDWGLIKTYIAARRTELLEDLDALTATDQQRRDAAVRRDELAVLLDAPTDTQRSVQAKHDADTAKSGTY